MRHVPVILLSALAAFTVPLAQDSSATAVPPVQPVPPQVQQSAASTASVQDDSARAALDELSQRLKVLERLRENDVAETATAKAKRATPEAGPKGFRIDGPNGEYSLRTAGFIQSNALYFFGDDDKKLTNSYQLRRVYLDVSGRVGKGILFRVQNDFAGASGSVLDAYVDAQPWPEFGVRAGRFKPVIGLEQSLSASRTPFVEQGATGALLPNRDVGVQLQGNVGEGVFQYTLGIFDGAADGAKTDADVNDQKDALGRVYLQPFVGGPGIFSTLGFGIGGSVGKQQATPPSYRSAGRAKVFSYKSPDTLDNWLVRWSPQGTWAWGPVSLEGEWIEERFGIRDSAARHEARLQNRAWLVQASVVLTGEDASFNGISPRTPLDGEDGGFGAVELVARYHVLDLDDDTFPQFADSTKSVSGYSAWGVGANWYVNRNLKLLLSYDRTTFDGGAKKGDRPEESLAGATVNLVF